MTARYFLTVDWCKQGKRGIFCNSEGGAFSKDAQHTEDEIFEILDMFELVLDPKSILLTEDELKEYTQWYPLGEFSNVYGYATKKE